MEKAEGLACGIRAPDLLCRSPQLRHADLGGRYSN